jgi:hypothetical protein
MHTLDPGKRVFAVGDIYGDEETPWNANFSDQIVTDTGIAGETRTFFQSSTSEEKRVELVYVQFDQSGGAKIPDRYTSRWVPRRALCTSRFGHLCNVGEPCVFCGYELSCEKA